MAKPSPDTAGEPGTRLSMAGSVLLSVVLYLVLIDAAVETFVAGAPVRWIVLGTVAAYLAVTVLLRRKLTFRASAWASLLVLLGLLAFTAWRPGGMTAGVVLLRQPTSAVMAAVTALAIVVAGWILVRLTWMPIAGKAVVGLLTLYGVAALAWGIAVHTPYPDLFHGQSLWTRLPFWLQGAFLGSLVLLPIAIVLQVAHRLMNAGRVGVRSWATQTLALVMSVLIAFEGSLLRHVPAPTHEPVASALQGRPDLKELMRPGEDDATLASIENLKAGMSPTAFDVDARASELGPDVSRPFAFVRDQVRYEVYEGVLRGAQGTLMAMAGNAFDKSLLLAALLAHHGVDVRFARGRLSEERAATLVSQMFAGFGRVRSLNASIDSVPPGLAASAPEFVSNAIDRWLAAAEDVSVALAQSKVALGQSPPVSRNMLIEEAKDHLWVEYRADDKWVDLDPTFEGARPGESFAPVAEAWTGVPASAYHRVTVRETVEERRTQPVGSAPTQPPGHPASESSAVSSTELPRAEIASRDVLRYEASAAELGSATISLFHELSSDGLSWSATPILQIGDQQTRGLTFDHSGSGDGQEISAVSLEFDFLSPSGPTQTVRREIMDLIGPVARSNAQEAFAKLGSLSTVGGLPLPLAGYFVFSVRSGPLHPGLALVRAAQQLPALRSTLNANRAVQSTERVPSPDERQQLADSLGPAAPDLLSLIPVSFYALSEAMQHYVTRQAAWGDVRFYEATPRLAIASIDLSRPADGALIGTVTLDLRRNELRAVADRAPAVAVVWANATRGVLDGVVEHLLLADTVPPAPGLRRPVSTLAILERAREAHVELAALVGAEVTERVAAPEVAKARMRASLSEAQIAVAPLHALSIDGVERFAWWNLDLRSGETLAVVDTGLHQIADTVITRRTVVYRTWTALVRFVVDVLIPVLMVSAIIGALYLGLFLVMWESAGGLDAQVKRAMQVRLAEKSWRQRHGY